ncbi:MAG: hypothetical protein DI543_03195 [Bradyrhizobium icense]|nr:MAG: hypothetical protein DI543_03195 [Bradyrhizobium icense]
MTTFASFLKVLLAAALIWFSVYLGVMGLLTTMLALSLILLVCALAALVGGSWLALHMLQRANDVWLRLLIVALIVAGTVITLHTLNSINWFKGF